MDIRQLRYFICVAEEGNFGRAARRLHISQPPLSQQIKALETSLDVTLFVRSRQGTRLTRAGEALLMRARRIVGEFDQVESMVQRVADGREGTVRIGIVSSVMYGPLPRALRVFQARNPGVDWALSELLPHQQIDALLRGAIDVGFARSVTDDDALVSTRVYQEPLVVALSTEHPLAACRGLTLKELSDAAFVLMDTRSPMVRHIIDACVQNRFQPRIVYESVDPQIILSLVGVGAGISVLPRSISSMPREDVVFVPLEEPSLDANLYVTCRRDDCQPALDVFLALLADVTDAWHTEKFGRPARA